MIDEALNSQYRLEAAEQALSVTRHDLRNRIGSVRNAAFFIRRRAEKSELWAQDARVPTFFELIGKELELADELLTGRMTVLLGDRRLEPGYLDEAVARALRALEPSGQPAVTLALDRVGPLPMSPVEVTLACRILLANALASGAAVRVETQGTDKWARLRVVDGGEWTPAMQDGAMFGPAQDGGARGRDLPIAHRIAVRHHGTLQLEAAPGGGLVATLELPLR